MHPWMHSDRRRGETLTIFHACRCSSCDASSYIRKLLASRRPSADRYISEREREGEREGMLKKEKKAQHIFKILNHAVISINHSTKKALS